jgi:hypothetical protein
MVTVRDFVMLSLGEIVLVLAFSTGILVGLSLCSRKELRNDNSNEGTKKDDRPDVHGR